ncbi:MAG: hypothetical protein HY868_22955 [Chloroflexi bacterium]|nr:hypothetical protein [Chloroflexota bacterium]
MKKRNKDSIHRRKKPSVVEDPTLRIIGLGHSGKGDISVNHDDYIVKAIRKKSIEQDANHLSQ